MHFLPDSLNELENLKEILQEPLTHYVNKYGISVSQLDRIIIGSKYSAVQLKNGHIGVCSNLRKKFDVDILELQNPDLENTNHRILITAYFNALLNYNNKYIRTADIFDKINFKNIKNIVMIGMFKPILKKFEESNIDVSVFDMRDKTNEVLPYKNEMEYVAKADAIILTSTSIFNRTFMDIIKNSKESCHIFLLGPSTIMNTDMFSYKNIKCIFGSVFNRFDDRVLDTISKGEGTRKFLPFGKKVFLQL